MAGTQPNPKQFEERQRSIELTHVVTTQRKRPLLIAYYPPFGSVNELQIDLLHNVFREKDIHRPEAIEKLDVLLHTTGGDPVAAYRLAQVIRDFAKEVTFLIPEYAYSAGTLMCLSADKILLGDHAVLSPIDITLVPARDEDYEDAKDLFPEEDPSGEVETVAIDYFIQVAKQARLEIESAFRKRKWKSSRTEVECAMLVEMTRQLGVLTIAQYYREKNITHAYAAELLGYMFVKGTKAIEGIIRSLIVEAPSHSFPMDFHMCEDIGLKVEEMTESLSDATKSLIKTLAKAAHKRQICPVISGVRMPFFEFHSFVPEESESGHEESAIQAKKEEPNGSPEERKAAAKPKR